MKVFIGNIIYATEDDPLVIEIDVAVGVDDSGAIVFRVPAAEAEPLLAEIGAGALVTRMTPTQFLTPGFVDGHVHAPQFPNLGRKLDLPLMEWLDSYTFPLESRFHDAAFAKRVYAGVVRLLLAHGTTTACYFATSHRQASLELARECQAQGQRALVGLVTMTRNGPEELLRTPDEALEDLESLVKDVAALSLQPQPPPPPLVYPIVTPRFTITCEESTLRHLGDLARRLDLRIQSHLSESRDEVAYSKHLFPSFPNDSAIFNDCGLLTPKTLMAHVTCVGAEEMALLSQTGVGVVHCPRSNFNIKAGLCRVRRLLNAGVNVCLGSDVSGGSSPFMLDALRDALAASVAVKEVEGGGAGGDVSGGEEAVISYKEAFRMLTLGGAKVLSLDDLIGSFEVGRRFDALLVDVAADDDDGFVLDETASVEDRVEWFLRTGTKRNISDVFVDGKRVAGARRV